MQWSLEGDVRDTGNVLCLDTGGGYMDVFTL